MTWIRGIAPEKRIQMKVELKQSKVLELLAPKHPKYAVPEQGSVIVWDKRLAGYGLRITAGGVASFVLNYRNKDRKQCRYHIGRWPVESADSAYTEALRLKN